MLLPNHNRAEIDLEGKLRDYCLNLSHSDGGHKARVFAAALGFTAADAETLRDAILAAIALTCVIDRGSSRFRRLYTVDFEMQGTEKRVMVRTNWIVDNGKDFARLASCFVKGG